MHKTLIGLTGTLCAGKGFIADYFKKQDILCISLSDMLREEFKKQRKHSYSREELQDLGDKIRREEGAGALAKRAVETFRQKDNTTDKTKKNTSKNNVLVIESIRNPAEIEELRKASSASNSHSKDNKYKCIIIGVDAPKELRWQRFKERAREGDPQTYEEFLVREERDRGENEESHGQKAAACLALADIRIWNDTQVTSIEEAPWFETIRKIVDQVKNKTNSNNNKIS